MFLVSLFIAQLSCAYSEVYDDMVGYARLERGTIIVEMMPSVPIKRWDNFVEAMRFNKRQIVSSLSRNRAQTCNVL